MEIITAKRIIYADYFLCGIRPDLLIQNAIGHICIIIDLTNVKQLN